MTINIYLACKIYLHILDLYEISHRFMSPFFISFCVSFFSIIIIDGIWLTLTVSRFYRPNLDHLWMKDISYYPAIALYLIYAFALSTIILLPAFQNHQSISKVVFMGFIFGLAAYGCYDITNQATLKDWPWIVTIVDMLWGASVTALVCGLTFKILKIWR